MRIAESTIAAGLLVLVLPIMILGGLAALMKSGWPIFRRSSQVSGVLEFAIDGGTVRRTLEEFSILRLPTLILVVSGNARLPAALGEIR